jgi:hypothetical protein
MGVPGKASQGSHEQNWPERQVNAHSGSSTGAAWAAEIRSYAAIGCTNAKPGYIPALHLSWRGGRVVEGARLERV